MIVEILDSFYMDVKSIKNKIDRNRILDKVEFLINQDALKNIPNLKNSKKAKSNTEFGWVAIG